MKKRKKNRWIILSFILLFLLLSIFIVSRFDLEKNSGANISSSKDFNDNSSSYLVLDNGKGVDKSIIKGESSNNNSTTDNDSSINDADQDFYYQYDEDDNVVAKYKINDDGTISLVKEDDSENAASNENNNDSDNSSSQDKNTSEKSNDNYEIARSTYTEPEAKYIPDETRDYELTTNSITGECISNDEYVQQVGIAKVNKYLNNARNYINEFYNIDYKDILTKKGYEKKLNSILKYFNPGDIWEDGSSVKRTTKEYVISWLSLVKKEKIHISAKFYTDSKLIYMNPNRVIRGLFQFEVKSCDNVNKLKNFTGIILSDNGAAMKPVDVGITYQSTLELEFANVIRKVDENDKWDMYDATIQSETILGKVSRGDMK